MKRELPEMKKSSNGKKIISHKQDQEKTKDFFLEKSVEINQAPTPYLIEDEFAKAKKNRNYLGLVILLSSCIFLITFAFFIVSFYEERQEKINLKIEEFSDINLEEVLKQASSFKNELLEKRENLFKIQEQKKSELQQISYVYNVRVKNLLNNDNLSDEIKQARNKVFLDQKQQEEKAVEEKYYNEITNLEVETRELAKKVNQLDQQAIDQAIKTDDFMGYQEKLLDTKIQNMENSYKKNINKIINQYEKRINKIINSYNPIRVSPKVQLVLETEKYQKRLGNREELKEVSLEKKALTENSIFYDNLLQFETQGKQLNALLGEINQIPFYNKTKEMIATLNLISSDYFNDLNNLFLSLNEEEKKKGVFLDFINFYLEKMGYVGVVIEIKGREGTVIINELFEGGDFTRGFFFNENTKKKISDFSVIASGNENSPVVKKNLYKFEVERNSREITLLTPIVFYN